MNAESIARLPVGLVIRRAAVNDAAVIARHRVAMFHDMGQVPTEELGNKLLHESMTALAVALADGSYVGWLALAQNDQLASDQTVAGAGAHIKPQLPRITHDGSRVAVSAVPLAVNVYTEPPWRRRGIARVLMNTLMHWSLTQGFDRVVLHASETGRPLYTSLGFVATNEMRWWPT